MHKNVCSWALARKSLEGLKPNYEPNKCRLGRTIVKPKIKKVFSYSTFKSDCLVSQAKQRRGDSRLRSIAQEIAPTT